MEFKEVFEHNVLTEFYKKCELEIEDDWVNEMNPQKSLVLYENGVIISAATVSKRFFKTVLDYIGVKEEYRGTGIGRRMLEKILKNEGTVYLTARNYKFFLNNGFKEITDDNFIKECLGCPQYKKNCYPRVMKRGE